MILNQVFGIPCEDNFTEREVSSAGLMGGAEPQALINGRNMGALCSVSSPSNPSNRTEEGGNLREMIQPSSLFGVIGMANRKMRRCVLPLPRAGRSATPFILVEGQYWARWTCHIHQLSSGFSERDGEPRDQDTLKYGLRDVLRTRM